MNIQQILVTKYPNTIWSLTGEKYSGLEWLDDSPKPTEAELKALWPEVQYETEYENVKEKRQQAYRDESDYLFFYAERGKGDKDAWVNKVAEIDARYPYPEKPTK